MALTYVRTHKACVTTYADRSDGRLAVSLSLTIDL